MGDDPLRGVFQGLDIAASGMKAEMLRAEVVAANISNMHVTSGNGRDPYRRRAVVFEEELAKASGQYADLGGEKVAQGVRVAKVYQDFTTPFVPRYEPGHPHADARGFVLTSNVDLFHEMVDMMAIERSFQANLTAMQSYLGLVRSTIDNMRS
jgi:flagellar basal-body rod protein FlgC